MATQAIDQSAAGDEAAAAPSGAKKTIMMMAIAGVLAGGSVGLFIVGPLVAAKKPPAAPAVPKKAAEKVEASINHSIENLVLNPAGTGGARFLMVTAVFQLKDGGTEQVMKEHEPEVRDRILAVLGKKGVDDLSDVTKREEIKKEVLEGVAPLFAKGAILKLFFSQFVIQ
ncbi:MAG: flagellar basal body-associated FliL family protein [Gemmatimonadaceae bacterium]